jgi:hypothetical protein
MRALIFLFVLFGLCGCRSTERQPRLSESDEYPAELLPDIHEFQRSVDSIDRVVIYYWAKHGKPAVTIRLGGVEQLKSLKAFLKERTIVPAPPPAMLDLSQPIVEAFQGNLHLFELRWQSSTKFEVADTQDKSIAGSYTVSPDWYERFMAYCEKLRSGKPDSAQPTALKGG